MHLKLVLGLVRIFALITLWLTMAMLWNSGRLANGPVLCWFRALTGHPCPFCGSTRAVGALCAGDLNTAWHLNSLGVIAFLCFAAYLVNPNLAGATNKQLLKVKQKLGPVWATSGLATLFAITWVWDIATRW